MEIREKTKNTFSVIGKEGSTEDGAGFVQRLWAAANGNFSEIQELAKRDERGCLAGIWGAMTDFSREFLPWQNQFSEGLYLAGVECREDAVPPEGWTKWTIPGFEYLTVKCETSTVFEDMLCYLSDNHIPLAGAVQDYTDPATGDNYMYFPIRKL